MRKTLLAGAALGFLAVALGAFGAHALKARLLENARLDAWQTAAHYQMVHAVLLVALALAPGPVERTRRLASGFLIAGTLLFSGSLYLLCLGGLGHLGLVTPLGGLCLLTGWTSLLIWGLGRTALPEKSSRPQMD